MGSEILACLNTTVTMRFYDFKRRLVDKGSEVRNTLVSDEVCFGVRVIVMIMMV